MALVTVNASLGHHSGGTKFYHVVSIVHADPSLYAYGICNYGPEPGGKGIPFGNVRHGQCVTESGSSAVVKQALSKKIAEKKKRGYDKWASQEFKFDNLADFATWMNTTLTTTHIHTIRTMWEGVDWDAGPLKKAPAPKKPKIDTSKEDQANPHWGTW